MKQRSKILRRDHRTRAQRGFTLIELMIAIVILTIGLLGTAGLTTGVIRGNFFSKNITSATAIAQSQLEAVQRAGYDQTTTALFPASAQTVGMGGVNFTRTTTITNDSPSANIRTVSVTVSWNEAGNVARSITLQTLLAVGSGGGGGGGGGGCDDGDNDDDDDCDDD